MSFYLIQHADLHFYLTQFKTGMDMKFLIMDKYGYWQNRSISIHYHPYNKSNSLIKILQEKKYPKPV